MARTGKKRWSAKVTQHSDALDLELLHQPRRQKPSAKTKARPGTGKRRIAKRVWTKVATGALQMIDFLLTWFATFHDADLTTGFPMVNGSSAHRPCGRRSSLEVPGRRRNCFVKSCV